MEDSPEEAEKGVVVVDVEVFMDFKDPFRSSFDSLWLREFL